MAVIVCGKFEHKKSQTESADVTFVNKFIGF